MNGKTIETRTNEAVFGIPGLIWLRVVMGFGDSFERSDSLKPIPLKESKMSVATIDRTSAEVVDRIIAQCEDTYQGDRKMQPGEPHYMTGAESVGDTVCQGDFWIVVAEKVPETGFVLSSGGNQLVHGNTEGAKHCLNTTDNGLVDVYVPEIWDDDSLTGPYLVVKSDGVVVEHPKHGDVHLCKDTVYRCVYQREYDKEQKRERRARD